MQQVYRRQPGIPVCQTPGADDHLRFHGQDWVNTSCCKFKGDLEGLETTHREMSMQQFLQHLRRGDELPPALPGFHEEPLRVGSKFWITVDARSYSLGSPASILAEKVRHSRSPSSPQPQDVP